MWTKDFWKALAERALKSLAQGLLVSGVGGVGVLELDWVQAGALALSYALASVLTSIVSGLGNDGNISIGNVEVVKDKVTTPEPEEVEEIDFGRIDPADPEPRFGTSFTERERNRV